MCPGPSLAGMVLVVEPASVPWVSAAQMREIDRVMIEDLGIELLQMMENAGRHLADLALQRFAPTSVTVLAGTGGNGGGALVAARHLHNAGVEVSVTVTAPDRLGVVPGHQHAILGKMRVAMADEPPAADLILDGLLGYSLQGAPRGRAADLIRWSAGRTVLALDLPSGLDPDTGTAHEPCIDATATLTLAAPKHGLRSAAVAGELYLGDISVPPAVFADLGFTTLDGLSRAGVVRIGP